uniref:PNPLA domain-containing protein n=1 Tax=Calcidiscus leptoporus TaxID=127549 RepID=A0A7S0JCY3_9EUKA|mmetsp:Transcript_51947/g.119504  ORF Transcript_51947/g.119504 Transcript_51947/m.119504 type:complete len:379 (+) Transcript_51947:3-1139(+)
MTTFLMASWIWFLVSSLLHAARARCVFGDVWCSVHGVCEPMYACFDRCGSGHESDFSSGEHDHDNLTWIGPTCPAPARMTWLPPPRLLAPPSQPGTSMPASRHIALEELEAGDDGHSYIRPQRLLPPNRQSSFWCDADVLGGHSYVDHLMRGMNLFEGMSLEGIRWPSDRNDHPSHPSCDQLRNDYGYELSSLSGRCAIQGLTGIGRPIRIMRIVKRCRRAAQWAWAPYNEQWRFAKNPYEILLGKLVEVKQVQEDEILCPLIRDPVIRCTQNEGMGFAAHQAGTDLILGDGRMISRPIVEGRPFIIDGGLARLAPIAAIDGWTTSAAVELPTAVLTRAALGDHWERAARAEHASVASFAYRLPSRCSCCSDWARRPA